MFSKVLRVGSVEVGSERGDALQPPLVLYFRGLVTRTMTQGPVGPVVIIRQAKQSLEEAIPQPQDRQEAL